MNLAVLQAEQKEWVNHNFPDETEHGPLLGLAEEVGELAHAHLKHEQSIRGYDDAQYMAEAVDAIGDIVIYLASYCNRNGIDLEQAVRQTWEEVSVRDWIKYPHDGRTK